MKTTIRVLGALTIVLALASSSHALTDAAKCDKKKSVAAGALFKKAMACFTKNFGDPTFDEVPCIDDAQAKCVEKFGKADEKFPSDCLSLGNGADVCQAAREAAADVYGGI